MLNEIAPTHLRALEAESIHIIREVAAEFENPVMLYSIGKDSSVMPAGAKSVCPWQVASSCSCTCTPRTSLRK